MEIKDRIRAFISDVYLAVSYFRRNKGVRILMYHMVHELTLEDKLGLCISSEDFDRQMAHLYKKGFVVIALEELVKAIQKGEDLARKSVVITFDDGFQDNYLTAFPILKKYGFKATIFLVADWIGKELEYKGSASLIRRCYLSWDEIEKLKSWGISFGCHSLSHPDLTNVGEERLRKEIRQAKEILERHLGEVRFFSYPYSRWNEKVKKVVQEEGFVAALGHGYGLNDASTHLFALKRVEIKGTDSMREFKRKVLGGYDYRK